MAQTSDTFDEIQTLVKITRDTLTKIPAFSAQGPWALLDWPAHANVGDSAIWLGTLALLNPIFGGSPRYVTSYKEYPKSLNRVCPNGPVLLHGGGNFGDIWPGFQEHRLRLLREFPHRRIVQLPQSIHFSSASKLDDMRRAIDVHPDFTLLVRDNSSFDFARQKFDCPVYLCPDMAYGLQKLTASNAPVADVFSLLRTDKEVLPGGPTAAQATTFGPVGDWVQDGCRLPSTHKWTASASRKFTSLAPILAPRVEAAYAQRAKQEVQRGVDILGQGHIVVTDRLHAHILCVLMGKPHIVLDNSYGKLSNFINTWADDGLTHRASSIEDVQRIVAELNAL